jgi:hypothetical protein
MAYGRRYLGEIVWGKDSNLDSWSHYLVATLLPNIRIEADDDGLAVDHYIGFLIPMGAGDYQCFSRCARSRCFKIRSDDESVSFDFCRNSHDISSSCTPCGLPSRRPSSIGL